jgi:hypothetical protein
MNWPLKKKPGATLAGATGQEKYGVGYSFLRSVQKPFFAIGWRIEQAKARIQDRIDNERSGSQ